MLQNLRPMNLVVKNNTTKSILLSECSQGKLNGHEYHFDFITNIPAKLKKANLITILIIIIISFFIIEQVSIFLIVFKSSAVSTYCVDLL